MIDAADEPDPEQIWRKYLEDVPTPWRSSQ
jgi:hypothetical protein